MKKYIERLAWGTDAGFYRLIPEEVLHPATEADVQAILARAHKEGKHVTFRAAGTSLSGQAISDSLLVVCGKKWEQYTLGKDAKTITLQPGIVGQRVNEILRRFLAHALHAGNLPGAQRVKVCRVGNQLILKQKLNNLRAETVDIHRVLGRKMLDSA